MPAKPSRSKFYAVAHGRATGVFRSWDECQRQVSGFSGASFKAFTTSEEAEAFVGRARGAVDGVAPITKQPSSKRARSSVDAVASGGAGDDRDLPADAAGASSKKKQKPKEEENAAKGIEAIEKNSSSKSITTSSTSSTFKQLADPQSLYALFFDGAARGNHVQGRGAVGGAGAVLYRVSEEEEGDETEEDGIFSNSSKLSEVGRLCVPLGNATNNAAEWAALELGLAASAATGVRRLRALGDSKLVINQLTGEWKTKEPALAAARRRACALASTSFTEFEARHVYREANGVADALSNEALDAGGWEGWKTPEGEVHAWRKLELRGGGGGGGGGGEEDEREGGGNGDDDDDDGGVPAASSSPPPPPPPSSRRGGSSGGASKRFDWSARALPFGGNSSGVSGSRRRGPLLPGATAMSLPPPPPPPLLLPRPQPLQQQQQQLRAFASPYQRRMMPTAPSMRLILRAARMVFL
mgnify:CR=1 FL=1